MQKMERKKMLRRINNLTMFGQSLLGISFASFVIMFTVCKPERMLIVSILGGTTAVIGAILLSKSVRERKRLKK